MPKTAKIRLFDRNLREESYLFSLANQVGICFGPQQNFLSKIEFSTVLNIFTHLTDFALCETLIVFQTSL